MKLTFAVNKSPDFIFEVLTDMDKFVTVHQVITRMDRLDDNRYLVHEKLKFGFIPYSFTYPVTIDSDAAQKSVWIKAVIQKLTHIDMHFKITAAGDASLVEETISIKTILPIKGMIRKVFREQHEQLFRNIGKL